MSDELRDKFVEQFHSGDSMHYVGDNNNDTISVCCVCCKILTGQTCSNVPVCSKLCIRLLEQTLAFVQGFVLCKLVCNFVQQLSSSSQVAKAKEPVETFSSDPTHSLVDACRLFPSEPIHSLVDTPCSALHSLVTPETEISAAEVGSVLGSANVNSRLEMGHELSARRGTRGLRERHGKKTKLTSPVPEESLMPAFFCDNEVPLPGVHDNADSNAQVEKNISSDFQSIDSKSTNLSCGGRRSQLECGIEFKTKTSVKNHNNKHRKKQDIKKKMACRICGKLCSGQVGLTLHIRNRHAGEKAAECEECGERFFSSLALHRHMAKVHNKPHGMCHICGKHFKYPHTLKEHIRAHTGVRGFVCELCGKSFVRLSNLCDHRRRDHSHKKQAVDQDCTPLVEGNQLDRSLRPKLNILQCRECRKTMENLKDWKMHMEEHKLNRTIFCQICGKSFKTQSSLYAHKRQHQEKRFQCDICSRAFTYKCNMERHRETHSEDRPHRCEYCQKTFKTEIVLNRHKAMHIEDRQYKCHICGRGLTCRDNLKKHLRVMHPGSDV